MIASEGEQKSSKALKEAADIIAQSPAALQLRYLQVCFYFLHISMTILREFHMRSYLDIDRLGGLSRAKPITKIGLQTHQEL